MAWDFGSQRSRRLAACQSDFYSSEIESTMGSLPTCHETKRNLVYRLHVLPPDAHTDQPKFLKRIIRGTMAITTNNTLQVDEIKIKSNRFLERAEPLLARGFSIIPCEPRGKKPFTVLQLPLAIRESSRRGRNDGPMLMWESL